MIRYVLRGKRIEKLVELAQSGLPEALDLILEKYYPMVVRISSKYYAPWAEFDDIVQSGLVGLIKAVFYYEDTRSSFNSYAWRSIEGEIQTFLTYQNRKKNRILSDSYSMDSFNTDDEDEQSDYFVPSTDTSVLRKTVISLIYEELNKILKDDETGIFDMWINGYSYKEISDALNVSTKKIDNTVQKVKRVLREKVNQTLIDLISEG